MISDLFVLWKNGGKGTVNATYWAFFVCSSPTWQSHAHTALEGSESVNYYFEVSGWGFWNEGGEEQGDNVITWFTADSSPGDRFPGCT